LDEGESGRVVHSKQIPVLRQVSTDQRCDLLHGHRFRGIAVLRPIHGNIPNHAKDLLGIEVDAVNESTHEEVRDGWYCDGPELRQPRRHQVERSSHIARLVFAAVLVLGVECVAQQKSRVFKNS
jgi:hypothetical protein